MAVAIASRVVGDLTCQKNSYLKTFDTKVVECVERLAPKLEPPGGKNKKKASDDSKKTEQGSRWLIEFADSVLFPEGGGQPSDHGTITSLSDASTEPIPIESVQRQGLRCICLSPHPLGPGTLVRQDVNFQRRWDHMQQHTGQHLLSAIMDRYENLETLGWGMGAVNEMNYVDLPRKPSDEELQTIQDKCNDAIRQNIKITVETPENAASDTLPEDYDKDRGVVRVIKIGDLDSNACCGTHLSQTSHISVILLGLVQSVSSGRFRLSFVTGDRAINIAASSIHSLRSISRIVSSEPAPGEVLAKVHKLNETSVELKRKEAKLLADIAKFEGDRIKARWKEGKSAFLHRPAEGLDFINMVIFQIKGSIQEGSVVTLTAGEGIQGGPVVIFGDKESVEALAIKVKEGLSNIKGGGRGERWQGKMSKWRKGDVYALEKLVNSELKLGMSTKDSP